jgi:hypothetical protein
VRPGAANMPPPLRGADTENMADQSEINPNDIAIVGMALRVPGAQRPSEYWRTCVTVVESIRTYTTRSCSRPASRPS